MTQVLVTGGTGFIGSWCVTAVLDAGHTVRTTVRDLRREPALRSWLHAAAPFDDDRLEVVRADLDVLQETWLRWAEVDLSQVRDHRAYLVRITTRQSLNRLRTMKRRREAYVGPWLPEPLLTAPDVAQDVELAESVRWR